MVDIPQINPRSEALKREMVRKSMDSIRVANPTEQDFVVKWDNFPHVIPNKNRDAGFGEGQAVVPRYIAEKYAKEMCSHMIDMQGEEFVEHEKIKRLKAGLPELSPYELNEQVWKRAPKTTNEQLIAKIYPTLYLGVEKEFGLMDDFASTDRIDARPTEERVLESLDRPYVAKTTETKAPRASLERKEDTKTPVADIMKNVKE